MQLAKDNFRGLVPFGIGGRQISPKWLAILSAVFFAAVNFLIYFPSLSTGFFAQDYDFLEPAARWNLAQYLTYYFDPRAQILWYRPLQGLQILLEYKIFGVNALPYHVVQIAFHVVNCLLLLGLVWRLSSRLLENPRSIAPCARFQGRPRGARLPLRQTARGWRLGFFAALLYATFPVYALAVNWINITDPLASIFYLLGIWFWLDHLQTGEGRAFVVTLFVFAMALLTKQMSITLPAILFFIDRLLIGKTVSIGQIIWRYWLFAIVAGAFIGVQYAARSTHVFAGVFGYTLSPQIASILVQYLSLLVFPWGYYPPTDTQITEGLPFADTGNLIWLVTAIVLFVLIVFLKRSRTLLFIGAAVLISLIPVLPFPFIELRYLYLPAMLSAILLALLFDHAQSSIAPRARVGAFIALALALLFIGDSFAIAHANAGIFEIARQRRVPFRDISSQHPTFPDDTHLYFIDTISPLPELSGMFTLRYGPGVTVGGNTAEQVTRLRDHKNAFVYFFDESGKPREIATEPAPNLRASLPLPARLDAPIALEGFEIARLNVRRGDSLVMLLYWRATDTINKNYTVFVHLVDKDGKLRVGYDSQPNKGETPTSKWLPHRLMVDAIIMPIPSEIQAGGDYRIEFGMYDFTTMQRLSFVDERGQPSADQILIESVSVTE